MNPSATLIPRGEMEGLAAVQVDGGSIPLDEPQALRAAITTARVPMAAAVILGGLVPWGDPRLDRQLHILGAAGVAAPWCLRPVGSEGWPNYPVWCVMDATPLCRHETLSALSGAIDNLPPHAAPEELILLRPPLHAIGPAFLDELALRLGVVGAGWIYAAPDQLEAAQRSVVRCATQWGVRLA